VRPSSAAQCVAYIAVIELPQNHWPEVIPLLVHNVTGQQLGQNELLKEASLESIGYICADIVSCQLPYNLLNSSYLVRFYLFNE